jgi:hypothetical protein
MGNQESRADSAPEEDLPDEHDDAQRRPYISNPFACFCKTAISPTGLDSNECAYDKQLPISHPRQIYSIANANSRDAAQRHYAGAV